MSNITNLTKALLKAQTQMGSATKGAKNPFFKSNYADLPTVMEVVKGPLNDNGILVLQSTVHRDGKNFVNTSLIHAETGEILSSETEVICAKQNDPQAFGAAQTYARRFGLQSFLFIPAEDDDGNYASGKTNAKGQVAQQAVVPLTGPGSAQGINAQAQQTVALTQTNQYQVAQQTQASVPPPQNTGTINNETVKVPVPLKSSSFSKKKKAAEPALDQSLSVPFGSNVPETVQGQNLFE